MAGPPDVAARVTDREPTRYTLLKSALSGVPV
jgi:hypothetical protein